MEENKEINNDNGKKKKIALMVFALIGFIGGVVLYFYLGYKATHISTDDAFIEGDIHIVASKVPGTVKMIYVRDNQPVKKGDLLLEIDTRDYEVRLKEQTSDLNGERAKLAEIGARIEAAKRQLAELRAAVGTAQANLQLRQATLEQVSRDVKRAENLYRKDAISRERYEKTKTAHEVEHAQVTAAREQVKQAEMAVESQRAVLRQLEASMAAQSSNINQSEARVQAAQLNYEYTRVYAPAEGYITRKSVEVGNQIQAGQPLMAVASLRDVWVVANYKETQLRKIRPGQKVEIEVDTYPGKKFKGTVDSIMAGTGAVFSLFPPENATGNFVKVVQRIPVKILLDKGTDPQHVLRIGMSVEPTVMVED
ncbi:MAG: HlyD family secretion protein [Nitrospirota bacterium]